MTVKVWKACMLISSLGSIACHSQEPYIHRMDENGMIWLATTKYHLTSHQSNIDLQMVDKEVNLNLSRLNGDEIRSKLIGRRISPDPSFANIHSDFVEQFLSDGEWASVRKHRGPIQISGRWAISGDMVCVTAERIGTQCRSVWISRSTGYLYLKDVGPNAYSDELIQMDIQ